AFSIATPLTHEGAPTKRQGILSFSQAIWFPLTLRHVIGTSSRPADFSALMLLVQYAPLRMPSICGCCEISDETACSSGPGAYWLEKRPTISMSGYSSARIFSHVSTHFADSGMPGRPVSMRI